MAKNKFTDYYLVVNLDERGDYSASVYDPNDKSVFEIESAEQVREMQDDGFLKYKPDEDLDRLTKYLMDMGTIPNGSQIWSEDKFNDKIRDRYEEEKLSSGGNVSPYTKKLMDEYWDKKDEYLSFKSFITDKKAETKDESERKKMDEAVEDYYLNHFFKEKGGSVVTDEFAKNAWDNVKNRDSVPFGKAKEEFLLAWGYPAYSYDELPENVKMEWKKFILSSGGSMSTGGEIKRYAYAPDLKRMIQHESGDFVLVKDVKGVVDKKDRYSDAGRGVMTQTDNGRWVLYSKYKSSGGSMSTGGEIDSVRKLYDKYQSKYPNASDLIAYFIFGNKEDDNIVSQNRNKYSELSELALDYEYNWQHNMSDIENSVNQIIEKKSSGGSMTKGAGETKDGVKIIESYWADKKEENYSENEFKKYIEKNEIKNVWIGYKKIDYFKFSLDNGRMIMRYALRKNTELKYYVNFLNHSVALKFNNAVFLQDANYEDYENKILTKKTLDILNSKFSYGGSMGKGGVSGTLSTTYSNPLDYLKAMGAKVYSDLNYSTEENGINYYVGEKGDKAIVVAFIEDDDNYMITKEDAREMSLTAKTKGINSVELYTNYGVELHSRLEKPKDIGFDKIYKVSVGDSMATGGKVSKSDVKIIKSDEDYRDAVNYKQSLYNFPVTVNYNGKKFIIGAGSSDRINILDNEEHKLPDHEIYIISENRNLNYISLEIIDLDKDTAHSVFLEDSDLSNEENMSYDLLNKDTDEQLKVLLEYLSKGGIIKESSLSVINWLITG